MYLVMLNMAAHWLNPHGSTRQCLVTRKLAEQKLPRACGARSDQTWASRFARAGLAVGCLGSAVGNHTDKHALTFKSIGQFPGWVVPCSFLDWVVLSR